MRVYRSSDLNTNKNVVSGYACVFEKESVNLGGFTEIIHRGAILKETINDSDIFATLDHDLSYIVARSRNGKGSLKLSVDDKGLYFEFELPATEKGNEIRSYLERDEINQCSFCFSLDVTDKDAQKWSIRNNIQYREIFKIEKLYDIALVFQPAYQDTQVSLRNALQEEKDYICEQINILNSEKRYMTPEEKQEQENNLKEIDTLKEEIKELKEEQLEKDLKELDNKVQESEEKYSETEEKENVKEDSKIVDENQDEEVNQDENQDEEINQDENQDDVSDEEINQEKNQINKKNKRTHINMKNFITKEIRNALESGNKKFTLNAETRAIQVTGNDGVKDNVVVTEIPGLLEPLYADSIFGQLGVRWYKGLPMGNISIPRMSKGQVGWKDEIAAASATTNTFTNVELIPHRLTAYVDISKQLIAQDTIGVNEAIRRDIVNALNDKLQSTILGSEAGDTTKPAGIFYDVSILDVSTFANLTSLEASIENNNVKGELKYLVSPSAKAGLRTMPKSSKSTELVLESGEVDGTPLISTSSITGKKMAYGDFSSLAIASWGNLDVTVDEYTQAINGCVRLIINAYFDAAVVRPEGLAFAQLDPSIFE